MSLVPVVSSKLDKVFLFSIVVLLVETDALLDVSLSLGIYKLFHILNLAATKKVFFLLQ